LFPKVWLFDSDFTIDDRSKMTFQFFYVLEEFAFNGFGGLTILKLNC
jgi:hypothetical protein